MRQAVVATLFASGMLTIGAAIAAPSLNVPVPVTVARATAIPACTRYVDVAFAGTPNGTAARPYKTIRSAVTASPNGAIICVAEGTYAEQILPGTKYFTLAGGFKRNANFAVRNSAIYVSKASGNGGSFIKIQDPGPSGTQLTVIDGFEITGYSQAIVRDIYYSQRFNITNNYIHDNRCRGASLIGSAFSLNNVSGIIRGNVLARNICSRGGGGALGDSTNTNFVQVLNNVVDSNQGTEPTNSHGGGLYLFSNRLTISANRFVGNRVTGWGAGLYVGADTGSGQFTTATLSWNIFRDNRAGINGGGFFCDDSAKCTTDHEIYDRNCGGNVYVDSGPAGSGPTIASFNHMTNVGARGIGCAGSGAGFRIDKGSGVDGGQYTVQNSIFWGNGTGLDLATSCDGGCAALRVTVTYSMVQRAYENNGGTVTFGAGILAPVNPQFVSQTGGNFHLKSRFGHWTATGYVVDTASSPALAKGNPTAPVPANPPRAGTRTELGAYGNSDQASYVR